MNENDIVKQEEFFKPEIVEVDYLLDKAFNECRNKCSQTFKIRCVYDIKFTNTTKN